MIWSLTWATLSSTTLPPKGDTSAFGSNFCALCLLFRGQRLVGLLLGENGNGAAGNQPAGRRKHRNGEGS